MADENENTEENEGTRLIFERKWGKINWNVIGGKITEKIVISRSSGHTALRREMEKDKDSIRKEEREDFL